MITKLIYEIAVTTPPEWLKMSSGQYRIGTSGTTPPYTSGDQFLSTSWTLSDYWEYTDGFKELNIGGSATTKYINPFDGTSLTDNHSAINNYYFSQILNIPINQSTYSAYLLNGVYLNDNNWESYTFESTPQSVTGNPHPASGNYWYNKLYVYNNGEQTIGHIILESTDAENNPPKYPYNTNIYYVNKIDLLQEHEL